MVLGSGTYQSPVRPIRTAVTAASPLAPGVVTRSAAGAASMSRGAMSWMAIAAYAGRSPPKIRQGEIRVDTGRWNRKIRELGHWKIRHIRTTSTSKFGRDVNLDSYGKWSLGNLAEESH